MEINSVSETISRIESRISTIINRFDQLLSVSGADSFRAEFEKKLTEGLNKVSGIIAESTGIKNIEEKEYLTGTSGGEIENILPGKEQNPDIEKITQLVDIFCDEIGVDPDLVKTMISVESNFDPQATSKCGAMGLMQLMPDTARSLGVDDAYDIYQNLNGGITMIKKLIESFNGDIKLALAAYNAGSGRVKEYGGVPPITETVNYVNNILSVYNPGLL